MVNYNGNFDGYKMIAKSFFYCEYGDVIVHKQSGKRELLLVTVYDSVSAKVLKLCISRINLVGFLFFAKARTGMRLVKGMWVTIKH